MRGNMLSHVLNTPNSANLASLMCQFPLAGAHRWNLLDYVLHVVLYLIDPGSLSSAPLDRKRRRVCRG